jgi:glutamyl-tRNA(Gln) amidotransferase subunit D
MLYYYPGMKPDVLDAMIESGYRGIIFVGTGLGHVNKELYPAIERAKAKGIHMFMTLQTIWGYVQMFVYDTGRDMMAKGIIPAGNMLPEVAWVKLSWILGQTNDPEKVKEMMLTPVNDEITLREPYNGYLVYQGGVPEVEEFIRHVHK